MKKLILGIIAMTIGLGTSHAQKNLSQLIAPQDQKVLNKQSNVIFSELDTLSAPYRDSVVTMISGPRQLALGTVIEKHFVLTKLSDIKKSRAPYVVIDNKGVIHNVQPIGMLAEHDLLLLYVPGLQANPIPFSAYGNASLGSIICAVSPKGTAHDFGVISVEQRSLRPENMPYLGISVDPMWDQSGVMVSGVEAGSGAHKSGIIAGDIITKLNQKDLEGALSIKTAMKGVKPGETVKVNILRQGQVFQGELQTSPKPQEIKFPQKRLEMMNSMGNRMNKRRDDFPLVLQSDITILPERTGCPILDLEGKFIGLALSRAGRMETYILPSWICKQIVDRVIPELKERMQLNKNDQDTQDDIDDNIPIPTDEVERW